MLELEITETGRRERWECVGGVPVGETRNMQTDSSHLYGSSLTCTAQHALTQESRAGTCACKVVEMTDSNDSGNHEDCRLLDALDGLLVVASGQDRSSLH